jgi:hypothetical protein
MLWRESSSKTFLPNSQIYRANLIEFSISMASPTSSTSSSKLINFIHHAAPFEEVVAG